MNKNIKKQGVSSPRHASMYSSSMKPILLINKQNKNKKITKVKHKIRKTLVVQKHVIVNLVHL